MHNEKGLTECNNCAIIRYRLLLFERVAVRKGNECMKASRKLGMRVVCAALSLLCLLSTFHPGQVNAQELQHNQTLTTYVRRSASIGSVAIGQMEDGTLVQVLGQSGKFYKVDCYDMVGYIAKSQIIHTNEEYYVNCQPGSSETAVLTYTDHATALELRSNLLKGAKKQIGSRYVYGASRPGAFDCSGLTQYLYKQNGIKLNRRASEQLNNGIVVPKEAMQVGDLIFFRQGTSAPASHVGIYVGNGRMIHAGTSSGVVSVSLSDEYYQKYFLCVRRVINVDAAQLIVQPTAAARSMPGALQVTSVSGRTVQ